MPPPPEEMTNAAAVPLHDFEPTAGEFRAAVLHGLSRTPKTLPCKFFYDKAGARLFEEICELEEYYPTRTELGILRARREEIRACLGPAALLVEPGSGSGEKTRELLDALDAPAAYVPIDISRRQLLRFAERLAADYPDLEVLPVCADYVRDDLQLPAPARRPARRTVLFFPGSTVGNFTPVEAETFLRRWAARCDGLLIGVDLQKDARRLEAAYNDARGVTAAFNLNLLSRINRELDGGFNLDAFTHRAVYDADAGRIEMRLVSRRTQTASVGDDARFAFAEGEFIVTEFSHKYTLARFAELAARAGWKTGRVWTDAEGLFSVSYLERG